MASIEPVAAQIAWYSYDMGHCAGILVRQLCQDLITGGPIKVFRRKATDDYTGWAVWGCSPILGRLAIERPALFAGKEILELGAGCGVAGLAVACCTRAASICLSDFPTETLRNTLHNVALNCDRTVCAATGPETSITTSLGGESFSLADAFVARGTGCAVTLAQLDWEAEATWPREERSGDAGPASPRRHRQYDVLLAADLLPREEYGAKVAFVARHLLRPGGIIIVVSPAARYGFATLEEGLREAGFVATHVRAAALPTSAAGPDSEAEGVPTAAATTAHEVVPDEWRVNPLRQPLAETLALAVAPEAQLAEAVGAVQVRAPAAVAAALGAASTSVSTAADPGLTSASTAALVEAVASGAAASFACPSACRHFEGFGGPARVPAPLHPSDAAADGPWGDGVSAAASALTTALYRAGGAGALRLVSASEAADMFPELGRPDYDILAAAFRAPLKPPAAVEEA